MILDADVDFVNRPHESEYGYVPCVKLGGFVRFKLSTIEKWVGQRERNGRRTYIDSNLYL